MTFKLLCAAALGASLTSGVAFAQTSTDSTGANSGDPANTGMMSPLDDPAVMAPFYSDNTMKTMKGADEMKTAWAALSAEDQKKVKDECGKNSDVKHKEFCASVGSM